VSVQILDSSGNSTSSVSSAFTVADAPLAVTAVHAPRSGLTESQGTGTFTVATFSDQDTAAPRTDFTATITWGDGSTSTVTSANGISGSAGNFVVQTSHVYDEVTTATVLSVQILDVGGSRASSSSTSTFTVADAPLSNLRLTNVQATEGISTVTVATFSDANAAAPATDFTATITWGDGGTATHSGAAGNIVSLGNGKFALLASHTYAEEGSYTLSVQVLDDGGASISGSLTLSVADAPLSSLTISLSATEGIGLGSVTVATFTDLNHGAPATDFTATVTWGDGSSSAASVVATSTHGVFAVRASHTYAEEGNYTLAVRVLDDGGASIAASQTLRVADAPLGTLSIITPTATEGKNIGGIRVANFFDSNLASSPADFTAIITWGDGTTSTVSGASGGVQEYLTKGYFAVLAGHTYAEDGNYTLAVKILDEGGASISANRAIRVADAGLTNLGVVNPSATEGIGTGTLTVATFADKNAGAPATDFTAVVTWGDGGTTTLSGARGNIVSLGNGKFAVLASHTYAEEGSYTLSVQVRDDGGASVAGSRAISIADARLANLSLPNPHATEGLGTGTCTVATFHDNNVLAPATDFTATITWGDGSTSTVSGATGGIVALGNGNFAVRAAHTYADEGNFTLAVQILDVGGASIAGSQRIAVADHPLTNLSIIPPTATEGKNTGILTLATFADFLGAPSSDFTAVINWGDGSTSTVSGSGIVAGSGGGFRVQAAHTYAEEGNYTLAVKILDEGGASVSANRGIKVADAGLGNLGVFNPGATEGVGTGTFTVATFADKNAGAPATDFTAVVTWGDGGTTTLSGAAGNIVSLGNGKFALLASHTYAEEGSYTLSVQVRDDGGASVSAGLGIKVADAALGSLILNNPHATAGQDTGTFTVATFHDNNVAAPTADFTAVVHWGDGTSSTITAADIVSLGKGNFAVLADHTFATAGTVTLSVQVGDDGAASISSKLKISVTPA
jgi:hypothetical protein